MLICGSWVVVTLVMVAHSAGAVLLLLFLPLPLAPPDASAAAGPVSAVAETAATTSIFLLNIHALSGSLCIRHPEDHRVAAAMGPWSHRRAISRARAGARTAQPLKARSPMPTARTAGGPSPTRTGSDAPPSHCSRRAA